MKIATVMAMQITGRTRDMNIVGEVALSSIRLCSVRISSLVRKMQRSYDRGRIGAFRLANGKVTLSVREKHNRRLAMPMIPFVRSLVCPDHSGE